MYKLDSKQGSPNQAKWVTFSPWFHWNCPIPTKRWSFSRPCQSLYVTNNQSYFFFNIYVKGAPMFLKFDPYWIWYSIFYSKLVDCILFKIVVQHICLVKGRVTCHSGERNVKILLAFGNLPHFSSLHPQVERETSHVTLFLLSVVSPE